VGVAGKAGAKNTTRRGGDFLGGTVHGLAGRSVINLCVQRPKKVSHHRFIKDLDRLSVQVKRKLPSRLQLPGVAANFAP